MTDMYASLEAGATNIPQLLSAAKTALGSNSNIAKALNVNVSTVKRWYSTTAKERHKPGQKSIDKLKFRFDKLKIKIKANVTFDTPGGKKKKKKPDTRRDKEIPKGAGKFVELSQQASRQFKEAVLAGNEPLALDIFFHAAHMPTPSSVTNIDWSFE